MKISYFDKNNHFMWMNHLQNGLTISQACSCPSYGRRHCWYVPDVLKFYSTAGNQTKIVPPVTCGRSQPIALRLPVLVVARIHPRSWPGRLMYLAVKALLDTLVLHFNIGAICKKLLIFMNIICFFQNLF